MLRRRSLSDINTLKYRNGKGSPAADLLACFPPPRPRLTLMPKPIRSPARATEPPSRHHPRHRRKSCNGSPPLWAKTKTYNPDMSEPTSPKVTCVGQIKVRPKPRPSSCKNWQSVMEEIERIHDKRKHKKRSPWIEALGFKRDVTQFLTCLRKIHFDFRCFGPFPTTEISSDDEEYDDDDDDENGHHNSEAVVSKMFMILREDNQGKEKASAPPANALMLMRSLSAPAKSWLEEREEEEEKEKEEERKQRSVVMRCGEEFSELSADIARETWVGEGIKDILARSRSCKR